MTDLKDLSTTDIQKPMDNTVCVQLQNLGCCRTCTLRFLGETNAFQYKSVISALKNRDCGDVDNDNEIPSTSPCSSCLGFLEPPASDNTVDKIVEALNNASYDSETFNIALTLPIAFYLRAHAFWLFLGSTFPSVFRFKHPTGVHFLSVKDTWKYVVVPKIEQRTNKKFDINSDLTISVEVSYNEDDQESLCLKEMRSDVTCGEQVRKRKKSTFSRKSVETILKQTSNAGFMKFYRTPPSAPVSAAVCGEVMLQHNSVFIAGRYNKFSRMLCQTPWLINNERRMESSVQEIIAEPIQKLARAQGNKFISSGREDVDVRMIGKGRPFALELLDPHKTCYSFENFRELERLINNAHGRVIAVRDLQLVSKDSLITLKEGEETKRKAYHAYCIAWGVTTGQLESLNVKAPLTIQQRTPVRVLHRRPIATRLRQVYSMSATQVKVNGDATYFTLVLDTQAGTYIKEFVHGDFGRTTPSIGELLGNVTADVLALDVLEISLNWPPVVQSSPS